MPVSWVSSVLRGNTYLGNFLALGYNELFETTFGISGRRDIGFFERTPDMVFSLERKKVRNKVKQLPTIHHK